MNAKINSSPLVVTSVPVNVTTFDRVPVLALTIPRPGSAMSYLLLSVPEIPATGIPVIAAQAMPLELFAYCTAETKSLAVVRLDLLNPEPSTISKLVVPIPDATRACFVALAPPANE